MKVKQVTGSICSVSCSPYVIIQQIKVEIEKRNCVSAHEQLLALPDSSVDDSRIILEDDKTLAHYGVFYNSTILQLPTEPQEIDICVKDMNGRTSVYPVSTNVTVLDLKRKIEGRTHIPVNQQRLTYNEKELEDGKKLSYYNITSKGTVYLLLRLRGGQI